MAPSTAQSTAIQVNAINPDDEDSMTRFLDAMSAAFVDVELTRAFVTEIDQTPPPYPSPSLDIPRVRRHIGPGITAGALTGADLVEAGGFSAVAVWETTSYRGIPFSDTMRNVGPVREEWRTKIRLVKEKYLGLEAKDDGTQDLRPFYHLGFLARNPHAENVRGAIGAVMRPWLQRAEQESVPVWLEAANLHAASIYIHYGFRLVETIRVGQGVRNTEGWPEENGEGVCGYAMIYDAHLRAPANSQDK